MSLNSVALCGRVTDTGVKLTCLSSGHPEAKLTMVVEEPSKDGQQTFRLFVPVVVYGARAETLAETLEPGDLVTVQSRLGWRAPPATKTNPKPMGKLVVLAWQVERLAGVTAPVPVGGYSNYGAYKAACLIPAVAKKLFSTAGHPVP